MRRIVVVLLLLNLGIFVWKTSERAYREPDTPAPMAEDDTVNRLLLLSELDANDVRERILKPTSPASGAQASADANSAAGSAAASEEAERRCYSIGPFATGEEARTSVQTWLRGRVPAVSLRQQERREVALYWIYFPPAESRQAASRKLEELKAKGLEDVQVVPKGDMANAVSLGVFSKERTRDRRLKELAEAGYEPTVADRYRTVMADWLDLEVDAETAPMLDELTGQFPGIELSETPCKNR